MSLRAVGRWKMQLQKRAAKNVKGARLENCDFSPSLTFSHGACVAAAVH